MSVPSSEFYEAYGRAVSAWAYVEIAAFELFQCYTIMRPDTARNVFHSAGNASGRLSMLEAAMQGVEIKPDLVPATKMFAKVMRNWIRERNRLVHGQILELAEGFLEKPARTIILDGGKNIERADELGITKDHLNAAVANFGYLAALGMRIRKFDPQLPSPMLEECRLLIEKLPNTAWDALTSQDLLDRLSRIHKGALPLTISR